MYSLNIWLEYRVLLHSSTSTSRVPGVASTSISKVYSRTSAVLEYHIADFHDRNSVIRVTYTGVTLMNQGGDEESPSGDIYHSYDFSKEIAVVKSWDWDFLVLYTRSDLSRMCVCTLHYSNTAALAVLH